MNWRTLTYEGGDKQDEPVSTPNHFLVGQLGEHIAPQDTHDIVFNRRNRWETDSPDEGVLEALERGICVST